MKIALIWIQWCGKWTQARILVEKYGFKLIEMWTEFRNITKSGTELWNKIKETMERWEQIPENLWKELMSNILDENKEEKIIYDWFIRNKRNLEIFNQKIEDYIIIYFNLPIEIAKERLLWRMFDPETWETFPSSIKINPKNGNILVKREDDKDEKVILKRISEFEEKTLPILEIARKTWKVIEINANQKVEEVTKEIEEKLLLK